MGCRRLLSVWGRAVVGARPVPIGDQGAGSAQCARTGVTGAGRMAARRRVRPERRALDADPTLLLRARASPRVCAPPDQRADQADGSPRAWPARAGAVPLRYLPQRQASPPGPMRGHRSRRAPPANQRSLVALPLPHAGTRRLAAPSSADGRTFSPAIRHPHTPKRLHRGHGRAHGTPPGRRPRIP